MGFDYRREFARFMAEWEKQATIMSAGGMSEDAISELYNLSYGQFKADRNYALHNYDYAQSDGETSLSDGKTKTQGMVEPSKEFDSLFDGLMQTDNKALLKGLKTLSPSELQVITLYCEKGMDLKQIAAFMEQKYDATQKQFYRAKSKLKKFL